MVGTKTTFGTRGHDAREALPTAVKDGLPGEMGASTGVHIRVTTTDHRSS
jgi:hypothetical protein